MQQNQKQQIDEIQNKIEGSVLKTRYVIGRLIDKGSFGKVFKCIDLQNKNRPLVVKIASDYKQFGNEINSMRKIYKKQSHNISKYSTPEVVEYGMILFTTQATIKEELLSYMIMPRYGQNLEHFFEKQKCNISNASILEIALGTLDMLESVHAAGYTYNDLKLDNIMVGFQSKLAKEYKEENILADASLHLVDFGFATRFVDKSTGKHILEDEVETFRGNMIFGSLNQLNFMTTSRRDDLISLCYMIIYMLNNG